MIAELALIRFTLSVENIQGTLLDNYSLLGLEQHFFLLHKQTWMITVVEILQKERQDRRYQGGREKP